MPTSTSSKLVQRYLQDAIASERNFESQFRSMAAESENPRVRELFATHTEETKRQCDRLTSRLQVLGGNPSTAKSVLAHIFGSVPKFGQLGQGGVDKDTHNLLIAYAAEQSEVVNYEVLKVAAEALGDIPTANLAEEIQREEQMTAQRIWNLIPTSTRLAIEKQIQPSELSRRTDASGGIAAQP